MQTLRKIITPLRMFLTVVFLPALAATSAAQTADEFFALGNNAYRNGDYARANENYENAAKEAPPTAELYYNLANTNAKLGNKGKALLNYYRAIYQNPRMPEAHANLQMFAKDTAIDLPQRPQIYEILAELSEYEWTIICFAFFWLTILLIFIPPLYSYNNMATVFLAIVSGAVFITSVIAMLNWRDFRQTAISVKEDVPLRLSPTDAAPVSSIVGEGETASIERKHGNFVHVATKNGKRGWASAKEFVPVAEQ